MEAMAEFVSDTGPPSPMFSPADVHDTPAAVSRSPSAASPGHWWDSPQPDAMTDVCAAALLSRPALRVSGGRPCPARAWLITARTWLAGSDWDEPEDVPVAVEDGVEGAPVEELLELRDHGELVAGDEGGFMALFEELESGLAVSGLEDGGAEVVDAPVELSGSEGVGPVTGAESALPPRVPDDVVTSPGAESALESVAPVVTTTAPMTAAVAATATAALAANCEAMDRAPALGIRRWE